MVILSHLDQVIKSQTCQDEENIKELRLVKENMMKEINDLRLELNSLAELQRNLNSDSPKLNRNSDDLNQGKGNKPGKQVKLI